MGASGGMGGWLQGQREQDLQNQALFGQMLDRQSAEINAQKRQQQAQQFEQQRQQAAEKFQQDQAVSNSNLIQGREWNSPQTYFAGQRWQQSQVDRNAIVAFRRAVAGLDPKAPISAIFGLAGPGVPASELADAIKVRTAGITPNDKLLNSLVATSKGQSALMPDGSPPSDPMMTWRDVFSAGGVMLTDKQADAYHSSVVAGKNLDQLEAAAMKVLPDTPGFVAGYVAPYSRSAATTMGFADYQNYAHAKAGLMLYLRTLTGVNRVSQLQLTQVLDALDNANTKEGMRAAIKQAHQLIANEQSGLFKIGRMHSIDPSSATPDAGPTPTPSGGGHSGLVPVRIEGGKVIYRGPDGKEYVQ